MKTLDDCISYEEEKYRKCLENNEESALIHKHYIELFTELKVYREKFGTKFANRVYELEEDECMCIYCKRVFDKKEKRKFTKKDNSKLCICFDCY